MNETGLCECGCGAATNLNTKGVHRRFLKGHYRRGSGRGWIECGYLDISVAGNKIAMHRWVVSQREGRKLASHEIVHHVNRDKFDNRSENLVVVTRAEHRRLHAGMKWKRWTPEEKARARELKAAGTSTQDVATAMNRGITSTTKYVCNRRNGHVSTRSAQ
jgi:hypothetical protein